MLLMMINSLHCVAVTFITICGKNNYCACFFVANLVFNLTICHFTRVFSECAG